ncbi:hypothetical protein AYR62_01915 [Secundilactobacillus paracollinoides]|uniref:CBS domain-containing protein n=1 Tax=Secundilactobacillus paracollinoides TaxID=240427 RepID=A0A1B2IUX1_9LACO|nr:helix-turn-helix transcriptional regulator [Secundilactobacillus paracollinoides]ANZ60062.1 hypothetical protein AYR61_01005 [Secundilactobacillus paracollinoides]ANZ62982.1 hypothetical protein AYR62_01915 [Secundilactobacillus paracollinoides]ANZ65855.1 hypothetical protein AYR63_01020 [Secundilactobacillus paracollinoides]KRL76777.1 hypothetical protein FC17_GL001593 [Secundilactobacillus paracollinoides DSM 15502 = JCM 11969]
MELTERQQTIIKMLKETSPLTGEEIATQLNLSVPTIRGDLRLLTAVEILDARPKVGYVYRGEQQVGLNYGELFEKPIADIMQAPVTIRDNATLAEAVSKLFLDDVGSLYVVDQDGRLVGLMSRKDLLRASFNNNNAESMLVSVIMTRMPNIVTVTAEMTLVAVGQLLLTHMVDSLPIVDKQDPQKLVGRITKNRIFQYFIEQG